MKSKKIRRRILVILVLLAIFISASMISGYAQTDQCPNGEHQYTVTMVKRPTETTSGLRKYTCDICGYTYTESIPSTGHIWGNWVVDKQPSCTQPGHRVRKCIKHKEFAHYQEETIAPLGHDYQLTSTIEPTASEAGKKVYTCRRCGDTYTVSFGSPTGTVSSQDDPKDKPEVDKDKSGKHQDTKKPKGSKDHKKNDPENNDSNKGEPFGAADAAILSANGLTALYFLLLLIPYIKVLIWVARKKREKEEEE